MEAEWSVIDIDQLDNKTIEEIKVIGESININNVNYYSKSELIDKIKLEIKIVTTKIKYLNKTLNNPFSKSTFDQLVIDNSTIEGKNELLFWKVIKNKSIYKYIISFLNVHPNPLDYDYIISVDKMLKNNQISILKDKVKCNKYITFSETTNSGNVWINLFKTIQNQDDKEFYQNLFKNYSNQLCNDNGINGSSNLLIGAGCKVGLMVLVEQFNFRATNETLNYAFSLIDNHCGTLDCINYLINPSTPSLIDFQTFKTVDYNQVVQFENYTNSNYIKTIERIECFVKLYKPTKQYIQYNSSNFLHLFTSNPFDHSLQTLIRIIGLLDTLNLWDLLENSNFTFPNLWKEHSGNTESSSSSLSNINNEIKLFKFSNQQLESNLNDPINRFSNERLNIKTLLYIFYSIGSSKTDNTNTLYIEYHLCFGNEIEKSNHLTIEYPICKDRSIYPKVSKYAMEYADYSALSTLLKVFNMQQENQNFKTYSNFLNYIDRGTIFKYCQDRELQIQFLNSFIKELKPTSPKMLLFNPSKIPPAFIFMLLVKHDDLELVKYYVKEIGGKEIATFTNDLKESVRLTGIPYLSDSITKSIKSIEMLDYIFNEFYRLIEIKDFMVSTDTVNNGNLVCQLSDPKLLNHYQNLYLEKQESEKKEAKKIFIPPTQTKFTVLYAQHVFNNVTKYNDYIVFTKYKPIDFDDNDENKEIYFSSLKNAINNTPINTSFSLWLFYGKEFSSNKFYPSIQMVKFIQWYKNSYPERIKLAINLQIQNYNSLKSIPYITNGYDGIFGINQPIVTAKDIFYNFELIKTHTIRRGDLQTFDKILTILLNKYNDSTINTFEIKEFKSKIVYFLFNLLEYIIGEEQILMLEFILLNHSQILKISNNDQQQLQINGGGIFTQSEFIKLINTSLNKCGLKVTELLLGIYSINKQQFDQTNKSIPINNNYKNKFQ